MSTFRAAFQAIFVWLFLCIFGSILIAGMIGGLHGAIIFFFVGAFTGLCGAVAHVFLLFMTPLRTYTKLNQVLVVSVVAMFICLVAGIVSYLYSESGQYDQKHFETVLIFLAYALVGIAPASFIVCSSMSVTGKIIEVEAKRGGERNEVDILVRENSKK